MLLLVARCGQEWATCLSVFSVRRPIPMRQAAATMRCLRADIPALRETWWDGTNDVHFLQSMDSLYPTISAHARKGLPKGRTGRKDKYDRFTPTPSRRVRLTDDDRALVDLVARHRVATSRQMLFTIGRGRHERAFLRRLQRLFHEEVLARPRHQIRPGQPARHMVYSLGIEGHKLVYPEQWNGAQPNSPSDWRQRDRRIQLPAIDHEVELTEFLLAMSLAAELRGLAFQWSVGEEFRRETGFPRSIEIATAHVGPIRLPLNPDAFISVDVGAHRYHWFLEIDMSTEPHERRDLGRSSIRQKMLAYQQLNAAALQTYDRRRERFGVLFVTTTAKRVANMRAVAQEIDPKKKGAHFFLFSTHDRCRLDDPVAILNEPRWWSAKIGYDTPRRLILDACPTCHQMVDPSNELHRVLNSIPSGLTSAPATTLLPDHLRQGEELKFAHASCPGR